MLDLYEELHAICLSLEQEQIVYAIVGGIAVSLYTAPRATKHIDLLIAPARRWTHRIEKAAQLSAGSSRYRRTDGDRPVISWEEVDRKLRDVSQLRNLFIRLPRPATARQVRLLGEFDDYYKGRSVLAI